jgi:hypothetical protein
MAITIPSGLLKDQAQVFINALKRPGVELGQEKSLMSLIARGGGVEFLSGGEYAERLVFEYGSGVTAAHFDPDEVAPAASQESVAEADIPWAKARAIIKVRHFDNARSGGGELQGATAQTLWQHRLENASKELFSLMEQTLQSGAGSTDKDGKGLPYWVSATGSVGSIARSTNAWLQSVLKTGSSAAIKRSGLREIRDSLYDDQGVDPAMLVLVGSALQRSKMMELLDGFVQATTANIADVQFSAVQFEGVPYIEIPGFPTDKVYFLHLPDWRIKVLTQPINETTDRNPRLAGMNVNGYPFAISELGRSGDWTAAQAVIYYQLICRKSWCQGQYHTLATAYADPA